MKDAQIHEGHISRLIMRDLGIKITERVESILKGLIREYQAGKLDASKAVAGIAQIAALRALLSDYERNASQGIEAMEELHN